jgi:signal transduction histidine kinase
MVTRPPEAAQTDDTEPELDELRRTVESQTRLIADLQRQVEELSTRRTLFLSSSAHELKTPLTVLQVYLETLRDEIVTGKTDEQISFVDICIESVLRLRTLVLNLVDLASLESGRVPLDIDEVEVATAIRGVVVELSPLVERAGLTLVSELDDAVSARADEIRFQQIVRNLMDNAIKNTPSGGSITVRVTNAGESVRISIIDTGIGIPADRLEAIFEEFVRIHPTEDRGGSGLGLAICSRLITAMNGTISVTSEEDHGSTFTITLPIWTDV